MTLNDRKETQETTNTPQRTVQTRATNERTRVTNEHYEKRCQRRNLLIVSDGAELASAQFFRGIQQETRTSPYSLHSLLVFPGRNKKLGQVTSLSVIKSVHCNTAITQNYYSTVALCTNKRFLIIRLPLTGRPSASNFILHGILREAPGKRAENSKQQFYVTNPI